MDSKAQASDQQFQIILEFMERHGDISTPSQPGVIGRLRTEKLWLKLADILNATAGGISRTPDKWKKVWAHWKWKTKKNALLMESQASGIKGEPNCRVSLTDVEKRLVTIMSKTVEANPATKEEQIKAKALPPLTSASLSTLHLQAEGVSSQPSSHSRDPSRDTLSATGRQKRTSPKWSTPTTHFSSYPRQQSLKAAPTSPPQLKSRRRFIMTPTDREISFVALEHRRLRLEERREKNESQRIQIEHDRNIVFNRFADIAEATLARYNKGGSNTVQLDTEGLE